MSAFVGLPNEEWFVESTSIRRSQVNYEIKPNFFNFRPTLLLA